MPLMLLPSFTSTNASVFCFRTVRTHPLTDTVSSETAALAVLTRRGAAFVAFTASVLDICSRNELIGILPPAFANAKCDDPDSDAV